ncbi:MAG: shikimate dehydrogenase [Pseudomonadota bacterium]
MKTVGVVGWPIGHSRSPAIFAHWFERYGVSARYELIPVPPKEADAFFAALPAQWDGVNVTIPHKETAARHVVLEGAGARLGVANTLWRDGDLVRGTSSDGEGFVKSLDAAHPPWRDAAGPAVVLGAGGAAVAIVDALIAEGRTVMVANRTAARAEAIAETAGVTAVPMEALGDALASAGLFVNTTALGMAGRPSMNIDLAPLSATATVADIVYNPLETQLLAAARGRGLATVDGLGMLLYQATLGFERWFGIAPEVDDELRARVVATL